MAKLTTDITDIKPKKDTTKLYLFFFAIAVLLATNIYYAIEYKNLGKKVELLSSEKYQLQTEVDRIEAELDRLTQDNPVFSQTLMDNQAIARVKIADLRYRLTNDKVDANEIKTVRFEVENLKNLVDEYNVDIEKLKKENLKLAIERDKLLVSVGSANEQVNQLTEENELLQGKVEIASGLKISGMTINAIQLRSKDREKIETKAKRVNLLRIEFDIVDNPLALKGNHDVFLRIMDPSGNSLIFDNGTFEANGKKMQYTAKTSIDFSNDGKKYTVDWEPKEDSIFQKGVYTVIMYADGSTMGRSTITLK